MHSTKLDSFLTRDNKNLRSKHNIVSLKVIHRNIQL